MGSGKILLTGSSGLIGTALTRSLREQDLSHIALSHRMRSGFGEDRQFWDPHSQTSLGSHVELSGITAAVHLAGANPASRRWTSSYKDKLLESRTQSTFALASMLATLRPRPSVLVCASATGIYGNRGNEILNEDSVAGWGFLPELCIAWEKAAQPAVDVGIRVVHLRFGLVLTPAGGALAKMLAAFRAGFGGQLGNGAQWMSWVALADAVRAIEFALVNTSLSGPVNVAAPNPLTNAEFTRTLSRVLCRPARMRIPRSALRFLFGEMAEAIMLVSQRVSPDRLEREGFRFEFPQLEEALRMLLG
jgi:uncharacterized protein